MLERFIDEAVESNNLQFGGGGGENQWDGVCALDAPHGSVEGWQKSAVENWLRGRDEVLQYFLSDFGSVNDDSLERIAIDWIIKRSGAH